MRHQSITGHLSATRNNPEGEFIVADPSVIMFLGSMGKPENTEEIHVAGGEHARHDTNSNLNSSVTFCNLLICYLKKNKSRA